MKKTLKKENIQIKKKNYKKKDMLYMFLFVLVVCLFVVIKTKIIDTEVSGLRIKIYFLFCIYGNQDTNMLHCFVVQIKNVLVAIFFNLIYSTVFCPLLHH